MRALIIAVLAFVLPACSVAVQPRGIGLQVALTVTR